MTRVVSFVLLALAVVVGGPAAAVAGDKADRAAVKKARREADRLIRRLGQLRGEEKRAEVIAKLDAVDARGRIPALAAGLRKARPAAQRVCVEKLAALEQPLFVPHFAMLAVSTAPDDLAAQAHEAAVGLDADYARRWYEFLAVRDLGAQRTRSLERLGLIRSPASVPMLTEIVATVGLEIHVQRARLKSFQNVPVNLVGGNTQVPIQLPTVELFDMRTSVQVPAATQQIWKQQALTALRSIVEEDLGEEPGPYRAWWEQRQPKEQRRPKGKAGGAAPGSP